MRRHQELIRIGAPFMRDRNGFSAPDQFPTAATEALPPPERTLSGVAVGRGIPAFHGLHRDPVADFGLTADEGPSQRGLWPKSEFAIARNRQMQRTQMVLKMRHVLHTSQPQNRVCAHIAFRCLGNVDSSTGLRCEASKACFGSVTRSYLLRHRLEV